MARAEPRARHTARLVTLSFLTCGPDVLLLRHPQTSDRFPGLWNGIGGHVEAGEDIRAAATRELREEAGVEGAALSLRAVVHESGLVGHDFVLFVFVGRAPTRDVHAPEGHELRWHAVDALADLPLVPDVALLLPRALRSHEPFFATESFDGGDRPTGLRIEGERHDTP
jgi:8-oxo-dGTP diphosphatase